MDLIRLLRSLEEFLYELVGWLIFFPRTLLRVLVNPGGVALYAQSELRKDAEHRYADSISPVLMLILSVVLAHVLEMSLRGDAPSVDTPVGRLLFGSEQSLLLTRSAVFCILALGAALGTLRARGLPVNRDTLREPFSIQAFLACPLVLMLAVAQAFSNVAGADYVAAAPLLTLLALAWYLWARASVYRALSGAGMGRAFALVVPSFLLSALLILGLFCLLLV